MLLETSRPILTCSERGLESKVAEQVERVCIGLIRSVGKIGKFDTTILKFGYQYCPSVEIGPGALQFVRIPPDRLHLGTRIFCEPNGAEPSAFGVQVEHHRSRNFDRMVVDVVFPWRYVGPVYELTCCTISLRLLQVSGRARLVSAITRVGSLAVVVERGSTEG